MSDLKTLAKEYLQEDFIQECPNGYGFTKIETVEEVKQIIQWINTAYTVLHFIRKQPDILTSDDHPYLLETLLNAVFAEEPALFSVMQGSQGRWQGDLDEEILQKLSYLNRFQKLYKPATEQEQASINHLLELYYQGDEQAESTLEHFVQMERPLPELLREMGYRNLLKEVA